MLSAEKENHDFRDAFGVNEHTVYSAALLNAAAAASMCCSSLTTFRTLSGVLACSADYTTRALYWQHVAIGADAVLISELMDEEECRQAHTLRLFLGNPFDPHRSPPMTLPSPKAPA